MIGSYDPTLVGLSILVAIMASYIALDLAGRVSKNTGRSARLWLIGGAFAMGAGIWSMHFIGMLAFELPVPMKYDFAITMVSMLFAIIISGLALALVSGPQLKLEHLVVGGAFMGFGICAMHYTGMAAMRMSPAIQYDPLPFLASVGIAIAASMAALWLAFHLRRTDTLRLFVGRVLAAIVMGFAIAGMHYTGMAAANFLPGAFCLASGWALTGSTLAFSIGAAILCIFAVTLTASLLDLRMARRTAEFVQSLEKSNRDLRLEIDTRARIQRELLESEARFRSAFEHVPVGMSVLNVDLDIVMVNESVCRMLGYTEAEMLARSRASMTHPDDRHIGGDELRSLKDGHCVYCQYEKRLLHKDGRVVWATFSVSVVRDADGKPLHLVAHIQDITERKQLTETLKARSEELERSNCELEQFAYVASHDLQAPLRSVTSFVQLLQRRLEKHFDTDSREYVSFIVDSTQHMQRLIHSLLELGRVGKQGVERAEVSTNEVLRDAQHSLEAVIRERGAVIETEMLPTIRADRVLLAQVLQNLIGNAIKFQPQKAPWVGVSARRGQGEWIFAVADHGIGIDSRHHDRIFKIFQRLHTAQEYEGNGVGLAMCEKIVRLHGGQIWLESTPGLGSTFYFTIPDAGAPARLAPLPRVPGVGEVRPRQVTLN